MCWGRPPALTPAQTSVLDSRRMSSAARPVSPEVSYGLFSLSLSEADACPPEPTPSRVAAVPASSCLDGNLGVVPQTTSILSGRPGDGACAQKLTLRPKPLTLALRPPARGDFSTPECGQRQSWGWGEGFSQGGLAQVGVGTRPCSLRLWHPPPCDAPSHSPSGRLS